MLFSVRGCKLFFLHARSIPKFLALIDTLHFFWGGGGELLRCCVIHVVFVCGHVLPFFSEGGTHPFMCSVEEEMEAESSSKTSMNLYQSVRRQIPVFFMDRYLRYFVTL